MTLIDAAPGARGERRIIMKQGDIYKSEGGYRVAWSMWGDGPIITNSPWYATEQEAKSAIEAQRKENERQDAIEKAITDGDLSILEKLDPECANAIREAGLL
jgi:uncharacterized protein YegP (UPF0339 family)